MDRPTVKHDARDNRITTVYDEAGRPTRKELPAGVRHTFGYDSLNRQTLLADPTGRYTSSYDERGLAIEVENPNGKTITYAYDALGRRDYMIDPDDGRTTYAYDAASRMTCLENPLNERTTWTYDNLGRATQQQLGNDSKATYTFDPAGQLTRLANVTSSNTMISSFDYSYDNAGNRTSVVESNGDLVTWTYDNTYQLTREQRNGANSYDVTHEYDPAGNRLEKIDGGSRTTSTYDAANQLVTNVNSGGTTTFTYDATGNLELQEVHDGTRTTNTWDVENHLTLVEAPSDVVNTMTYRADGLRVEKEDGTGTSKFVWDGQNILTETDGNDDTQAVYTLKPAAYGNLLSQRRKVGELWVPHFFHFDALGSTSELTDINELASDSYIYRAYGKLVTSTGNTVNPFRWVGSVGYFYDPDLLEYYVRARHYNPALARWISADPIGFAAGDANLYRYVGNGGTNAIDPTGTVIAVVICAKQALKKTLQVHRVTGYQEGENGTHYWVYGEGTGFTYDGLTSEILGTMTRSNRVFVIKGINADETMDNLFKHIASRKYTISAARSVSFGFKGGFPEYNTIHWGLRTDIPGFGGREVLVAKTDVFSAVGDLWENSQKYAMACGNAVAFVMAYGISQAVGKEDFNKYGSPGWGYVAKQFIAGANVSDKWNDWIPGDVGYIDNTDPAAGPLTTGENIIYLGDHKYWGHVPTPPSIMPLGGNSSSPNDGTWFGRIMGWNEGSGKPVVGSNRQYPNVGLAGVSYGVVPPLP